MPILEIEIVTDPGEALKPGLAQSLADAAGDVLGTQPGRTWVRLRALPREHFAENRAPVPAEVRPVFVRLLKSKASSTVKIRSEAPKLSEAIAKACGRTKENVHILYLPEASGRMCFGGELVTS